MRRTLITVAWGLTILLLLGVGLSCAVLVVSNMDDGRALIERLTARLSAGHVQLSGLGGSFPAAINIKQLRLSDEDGIWLTAEHVSLRWSPLALLERQVRIDSLQLTRLHIERRPVASPGPQESSNTTMPRIDVDAFSIDALELGATLAGTPTSLSVRGNAHARSLQEGMATVVAHRTNGVGDYELQIQFTPEQINATLRLQEPASGPLENLLHLPGLGRLSVMATLSGPRTAERIRLSLDAGALRGRAEGVINLIQLSADLDYTLEAPAVAPRAHLAWQHVAIQGNWHGTVTAPSADVRLQIQELRLDHGMQVASLSANLKANGGALSIHSTLEGLTIPGPVSRLLHDAPLTIDASMRLDEATRPLELAAVHRLFVLHMKAITAGEQNATLELHVPELAPLAALGGQDASGEVVLGAQLRRERSAMRINLDASVALHGGTAVWVGALGDRARLQVSAALSDDALSVESALLTGRALTLSLAGSVPLAAQSPDGSSAGAPTSSRGREQELDVRWELNLSNLAALQPQLAGNLKLSGRSTGPLSAFSAEAELTSTLSVRGAPNSTVSAVLHSHGLPGAPSGTLQANGDVDGAPLQLEAAFERFSANAWHVMVHHADWKSAHLAADVASGADVTQARGQFQLRVEQLSDLDRLLGTNVQGSVAGFVTLTPIAGRTHARLNFETHDLVLGGIAANTQLTADGPMDALSVDLRVQWPDWYGAPASLSTQAQLNLSTRGLKLASAEARYRGQALRLLSPAQISFANGLSISRLELGAQQAVLEVNGRVAPALDLHASLRQLKPALINAFVPDLLSEGTLGFDAQLRGTVASATGQVHLDVTGLRLANQAARTLPGIDVHVTATLMGATAQLEAKLVAGNSSQLVLSGRAPLTRDAAFDLELTGKLDVALFAPLLEAGGRSAAGQLALNARVTGSPAAPDIAGTVQLSRGELRDYVQGVHISDITAQLEGNQGMLRITSLTAHAAPGSLSVVGTIGVLQPGLPLDLKLTAKNAQPIASNLVTANLDADLHLSGMARERLEFAGNILLNRTNVRIPHGMPADVAVLDVRRPGQTSPAQSKNPLVIALDVTVQAPHQFLVQGRGLDAELGGEVHLGGTSDAPLISGGFDLQRGSFTLASTELKFTTGRVSFNGTGLKKRINPSLDFTAQTTTANITATLRVSGVADSPKFELSSIPELPQDEILARLLFGESAAQLTPLQLAQIGGAVATLSGAGGGLDPLAKVRQTLGLDRLSIGAGTSGSSTSTSTANTGGSAEVGRYLTNGVYVGAKQSTTGVSQLQVDVDLTKHLKLQTRLGYGTATAQGTTPGNDPGSSVGLSYQFEY